MTPETESLTEASHMSDHSVPLPGIIAQSVGAMGVTGIVALLVPLVAVTAGSGGWLTWILASVVVLMVAWCVSRLANQFATTGGPYGLVSKSLGRFFGVMVGWTSLVLIGLFTAGGLVGFGIYADQLLESAGLASGHAGSDIAYAIGLVGALVIAISGIKRSAVIMLVLEVVTVLVIVVLMVGVLVNHPGSVIDHSQLSLRGSSLRLVVDGFVLAVLSFGGFETATVLGREARNPLRAIPVAMLVTVAIAGVFWAFCGYTLYLGFEGSHHHLATAAAPLKDLAAVAGMSWLGNIIDAAVTLTLFGSLIAVFNGVSRLMFTMAREGLAPAPLMRVHRRWGTPWVAYSASWRPPGWWPSWSWWRRTWPPSPPSATSGT